MVVRRIVVTLLALGNAAVWTLQFYSWWSALIMIPLVGAMLLAIVPSELAELEIDGPGRLLRVRTRGVMCWFSRREEHTLETVWTIEGGLVPERGGLAEHGLAITIGERSADPSASSANPRFSMTVAGIDRRDEVRQLAEVVAARLACGLDVVADDLRLFCARLVAGDTPAVAPGSDYRGAAQLSERNLALARAPGFEEPREPPPNPTATRSDVADTVTQCDVAGGRYAVQAAPNRDALVDRILDALREQSDYWLGRLAIASLVGAVLGAIVALLVDGTLWMGVIGVIMGAIFPWWIGVSIGGGLLIGLGQLKLFAYLLHGAFLLLHGVGPAAPGRWLDVRPRSWSLDVAARRLAIRGTLLGRNVSLRRASVLALASDSASPNDGKPTKIHTLWLRIGFRWFRLLATRPLPEHEHPHGLDAFAVALGRALDLPIRHAGHRSGD